MDKKKIIYKTTNLINGKIYIGQDSNNNTNYLGSGKLIKAAIKKYGSENFLKEILEECNTKILLNEREVFWIKYFTSTDLNIGYNISRGGNQPLLGRSKTYDERKAQSLKLKGRIVSKETRKKLSLKLKGKKSWNEGKCHSEQTKQKIANSHKGKESKLKGKPGHPVSEATKIKIAKTLKEKYEKSRIYHKSNEFQA